MADRGDIFIRIVIVVGIMEWVCVGLWPFSFAIEHLTDLGRRWVMETFLIVLAVIALSWRPGATRAAEPAMPVLEMEPADE
jgi:hypothetical protein